MLKNESKTRLSAEQRRDKTVRAVIDICSEQDPAVVTTALIAKKMDVTQGALFRHFPSKESIWETVITWVTGHIIKKLDAAIAIETPPLKALEAMFYAHMRFIKERPGIPRILFSQLQHTRVTPARRMVKKLLEEYSERVAEQLIRANQLGELRDKINIEVATMQYIGMIQGLVMQALMYGDFSYIEQQAPAVFDFYYQGIVSGGQHE